ncbi:DUF3829 domain-containing protein [Maribacter antarcticus]|uniref:DUF3829 domain-containing protein n=1 Tax=Maribacter antarcticus TaxID=505250 RepID=UPI00047A9C65|nr:DUF3829 domain-containing protein [Maribacter antarcticus]
MKRLHTLLLLILVTTTFQSCKDEANTSSNKKASTNTNAIAVADKNQAYIYKYNAYIAVWNDVTPRVKGTYATLFDLINDKTGRPLEYQDSYFIPSLIESRAIVMLTDIVNQEPAIEELDALAPSLISSYKELLAPLKQLSEYYKLQSYTDDDFEKGAELYFKAREPIKKFIASSDILGPRLQEIDARLLIKALAEYKEKDKLLLYNKGMLVHSIKKHSAPLYGISFQEYKNLNLQDYDQTLNDIIQYYTDFKALAKDKERLKKEMNISRPAPFTIYYLAIDTYLKEAQNLKNTILEAKKHAAMKSKVERMGIQYAAASHLKVTAAGEKVISSSNALNR